MSIHIRLSEVTPPPPPAPPHPHTEDSETERDIGETLQRRRKKNQEEISANENNDETPEAGPVAEARRMVEVAGDVTLCWSHVATARTARRDIKY